MKPPLYGEKRVAGLRVTRLLELPWVKQLFLHFLRNLANSLHEKKKRMAWLEECASLAGKSVLTAHCRVLLPAGPTFLDINT